VIGADAQNQDAANFVFARAFDQSVLSADTFIVGMGGVGMADGNDIGGRLAEVISHARGEGVGDDDGLAAPDAEAGMAQPGDIHLRIIAYLALEDKEGGGKKRTKCGPKGEFSLLTTTPQDARL
jgi:hypothetical protein